MKKLLTLWTIVFMFCFAGIVNAAMMNFDDLDVSGHCGQITTYQGFNFINGGIFETDEYTSQHTGYYNGAVSPHNVLLNWGSQDLNMNSGSTFTFNDAYFTAAWNDELEVEISGWLGTEELYNSIFHVDTQNPYLATFNWTGIDSILIETQGGINHGYEGAGTHVAIDNLRYNEPIGAAPVPEPATVLLMGVGLAGLAGIQRKRMNSKK